MTQQVSQPVTGGNVTPAPVPATKRLSCAYMRATGVGAKRLHELIGMAQSEGVTLTGTYRYHQRLWWHRSVMFNVAFHGKTNTVNNFEKAVQLLFKTHDTCFLLPAA